MSDLYTKVFRSAINVKIVIIRRFCMADELNGQACPFIIQNLIKITITKKMALHGTLVCGSENWCTYSTWFVLSSGVFYVFDQTLAEQLVYCNLLRCTLYGVQHIHINLTLIHCTFYCYADANQI